MSKQYVSESCSEQVGTVLKVEADKVWVVIEQKSACASCHARGACSSFDKKDKEIEVRTEKSAEYKQGDKVKVSISTKLGLKAVVIAFIIPFVLLLIALILSLNVVNLSEALSCLISLLVTAVYYFILFKQKDKLYKQFVFKISHC